MLAGCWLRTHARAARALVVALASALAGAAAAAPDRPVITEIYVDPPGANDGPVGRDLANLHQEYLEIYLPTAAELHASLDKDSLDLTIYDVEGDASSTGVGLVNYRIDLPTFDLDPSNGLTGLARPASGIVVVGWVDYVGDPPTALAGTPATRVALVNGGVTSTPGYTFVALNGNEFAGTTNFPTPLAISAIDASERTGGLFENGSSATLLVNRDSPAYAQLFDEADAAHVPPLANADPNLPSGAVLGTAALLDAVAANDHRKFDPLEQPYATPTGDDIDLETVLPLGGAFSRLVPQLLETEQGYARLLVDVVKTTEDASAANDDPVADALGAYRTIASAGPFFPTPGVAPAFATPAQLSVADASVQVFPVLAGTTGRPGLRAANLGGDFGMDVAATPGASSAPGTVALAAGAVAASIGAQERVFPQVEATVPIGALDGALATSTVTVAASNASPADPPVANPVQAVTATFQVLSPVNGKAANGLPFQATTFAALQPLPPPAVGTNEFATTSLGAFVAQHLGSLVADTRGNGATLVDPATNLGDPVLVDAMEKDMPDLPAAYIDVPSPAGLESLVATVLTSAEWLSGADSYTDNFNATFSAVRAIDLALPETATSGGVFRPSERVHFVDALGGVGDPTSGLTDATSDRGFEVAIVDTNVQQAGTLETGATDDFGLVVEVGAVRPGALVVPGQFVFLSFTGGFEGTDIDTLEVAPGGARTVVVYLDLDLLDTVLGACTIRRLMVVDAGTGSGAVNVMEAFSLNVEGASVPAVPPWHAAVGAALLGAAGLRRLRRAA